MIENFRQINSPHVVLGCKFPHKLSFAAAQRIPSKSKGLTHTQEVVTLFHLNHCGISSGFVNYVWFRLQITKTQNSNTITKEWKCEQFSMLQIVTVFLFGNCKTKECQYLFLNWLKEWDQKAKKVVKEKQGLCRMMIELQPLGKRWDWKGCAISQKCRYIPARRLSSLSE